ncbi:CPCC family cysteine-rich protein [Streptomyces nodosus]|uniref:Cysteine-rich CPCC domain-containing protein n=1 Tax=Streptomyces nodosus TaxID=40318 RepID=A0A0B5DSZ1_9ACTN|nr:CPCC family cysteine-rich protein [Streptomyces nodosus]AJE43192.1 hypothetical protein SNOD_26565 [Streptomyces nodosus]MBB4794608.1 hypothetical protein [Streptomyces nodosus]QEV41694.1 hypothetical protein CP978_26860 [Streptomyces nodosus]
MNPRHPCPCCGHLVLDKTPGSHAIRPGANKTSLIEARHNHRDFGACDQQGRRSDSFEIWGAKDRAPRPADPSALCWWLPTFWRRDHSAS